MPINGTSFTTILSLSFIQIRQTNGLHSNPKNRTKRRSKSRVKKWNKKETKNGIDLWFQYFISVFCFSILFQYFEEENGTNILKKKIESVPIPVEGTSQTFSLGVTSTTQTKPNQTKPNQTKPNQTKPNQTKPNQTKQKKR